MKDSLTALIEESKCGPFGIPYSVSEVLGVADSDQLADIYHRHLMAWAGNRILELEAELRRLNSPVLSGH